MKYYFEKLFTLITVVAIIMCSCSENGKLSNDEVEKKRMNSVYYWRTVFSLDTTEEAFLERHKIDRIYLKMFDVAIEDNYAMGKPEVVPIATMQFKSAIPNDIEIVPVVYITLDALRAMSGRESEFASLLVERLKAMMSYNKCGEMREMQLDCDWTKSTKKIYSSLCSLVKEMLGKEGIKLSVTIRLHQLQETPPEVDSGVLMLYNTGALKDAATKNSILDVEDVEPYLDRADYSLALDYAYPTFGWGVKFKENEFVAIVSEQDTVVSKGEHVRIERPSYNEIILVKQLVEKALGKPKGGNILYHLDNKQLKNYTEDEINQIFAY